MFSIVEKNIDFYNEFYVQLLCEFSIMLNYDEMNYTIVFRVIYNVFWSADSGYMK